MKRATVDDPARIGEARDSVVRAISERVAATLAEQLDRVIFMALCVQFGGPYFSWEDLRGRCQCVTSRKRGQPDVYLLDGRAILEILHDYEGGVFSLTPPLESLREISAGFRYRLVPRADA